MLLDRQDAKPLHKQLEEIILSKLDSEEWPANSMIPSESELTREYGVSRMTIRVVLDRLVSGGLLYRVPGKGTFVSVAKIESLPLAQHGIREQLEQMGYQTTTRVISLVKISASPRICKHLNLQVSQEVYQITRVRYVKSKPFSIHTSYLSLSQFPDIDCKKLEEMQLCDIVERIYGYPIIRRVETLEAVAATPEEASLLELENYHPLLMLENDVYTTDNQPIEYNKVLFRGDRIKLRIEYNRDQSANISTKG